MDPSRYNHLNISFRPYRIFGFWLFSLSASPAAVMAARIAAGSSTLSASASDFYFAFLVVFLALLRLKSGRGKLSGD